MITLWGYFRSSAAYRVRIALNLKDIAHEQAFVHLAKGEQANPAFVARNPQGLVPALEISEDGEPHMLTQSLAILEYLEERYPDPALLPADPVQRAKARAIANMIACDIHPLNNLRVLKYLRGPLTQQEDAVNDWYHHWVKLGFDALEPMLGGDDFCVGDAPSIADACLVPQLYNARRFKVDLTPYPNILAIAERCDTLPAFDKARPENQPDAE